MSLRRNIMVVASVLLVFFALLIARLPASWLQQQFARDLPLENINGSVWQGQASVSYPQFPIETIRWRLEALPLLLGVLQFDFTLEDAAITATGRARLSRNKQRLEFTTANLDASRFNSLGYLPFGIEIAGDVLANDIVIERQQGVFSQAQGTVRWSPAYLLSPQAVSLQAYLAVISHEEQQLLLHMSDQGGPLEVDGLAWLAADLGYRYAINLRVVEQAPQAVKSGIANLGRSDADGVVHISGSGRLY